MDLGLSGQRAIVTGGSGGLGRMIALALADEGADVAICARHRDEIERTLAEVRERGRRAFGAEVDVTDGEALSGFVESAALAHGGLEILVASAGGLAGGPNLEDVGVEDWETTLALNVLHPAIAARAAVPWLRDAGGGAILFIGSVAGTHPRARPQYGAAKAAEIHLAASLAPELAPHGIRVNALSPGSILVPGSKFEREREANPEAFSAWERSEFPFGRLGTAEEVADVACFLLSGRASWISGANLVVDGAQMPPNMVSEQPMTPRWRPIRR